MGQFHTKNPQPGDQIFFTNDSGKTMYHTGIVEKVAGGRVYTIEGNTSSLPGVVENGGCVRDKSYSLSYAKIGGYGRPDFSIVEEDDDMDQTKFNEMFKTAMAAHQRETAASGAERPGSGLLAWACLLATEPPPTASPTICGPVL